MHWILFALIPPAIDALVIFIDKYVLTNQVKDSRAMPLYSAIVAFIVACILFVITGFPILSLSTTLLVLITGMIILFGYALYFIALADEQSSSIIILLQTIPLFVLIFSVIFLREIITFKQVVGFIFILISTLGVTIKSNKERIHFNRSFLIAIFFNILFAASTILMKFAINMYSYRSIISYESFGMALGGLFLFIIFKNIRKAFITNYANMKEKSFGIIFINENLTILSKLIGYFALSLGPASLVSVTGGTMVFYGLLYGFILASVFPKTYSKEGIQYSLLKKFLLSIVLFIGIILIY